MAMTTTTTEVGAVSWGAVIAGAVGAAALSLVLFLLGTGLGLAVVSPWVSEGIPGTTAGVSTIAWVAAVQLLASALGGYLAGRLRTRWVTVHTDEVFFRDTAHGFLAWAVATLLMATLLSSAIGTAISTGLKAGGEVAKSAVTAVGAGAAAASSSEDTRDPNPLGYFVDSLFRVPTDRAAPAASARAPAPTGMQPMAPDRIPEVTRILANALQSGELAESDRQYVGQLVAANTGLTRGKPNSASPILFRGLTRISSRRAPRQSRLQTTRARRQRRSRLWLVISLFVGAFFASFAATFGGRLRDSSVLENT